MFSKLWVVNVKIILLYQDNSVHPILSEVHLVSNYGFPEGYCVLFNESASMDGKNRVKLVNIVALALDTRKMYLIIPVLVYTLLLLIF